MDQKAQDIHRTKLVAAYEERGFECFAMYSHFGKKWAELKKQVDGYEERIRLTVAEAKKIHEGPNRYSAENRALTKAHNDTVASLTNLVNKVMGPKLNQLLDKSTNFREEAIAVFEQAESLRNFNLKTPEEIKADTEAEEKTAAPEAVPAA